MKLRHWIAYLIGILTLQPALLNADYQISGERKQWHKVTITFDGPESSESGTPNPFFDYRLDVTFSQGDRSLTVPGYFAADGNAAESSASKGNKWRVHFMPETIGEWNFKASFRWGEGIAVSDDPNSGQAISFDGTEGQILVGPSNKAEPVMRKYALWGNLMAGGSGVEWYFGYELPHSDLNCEDWRSREKVWEFSRFALNFFQDHLPFQEMMPDDQLTSLDTDYVLAKEGEIYAIYFPEWDHNMIDLRQYKGAFSLQWFNPRTGDGPLTGEELKENPPFLHCSRGWNVIPRLRERVYFYDL